MKVRFRLSGDPESVACGFESRRGCEREKGPFVALPYKWQPPTMAGYAFLPKCTIENRSLRCADGHVDQFLKGDPTRPRSPLRLTRLFVVLQDLSNSIQDEFPR
jgi:hypothetical protein